MVEKFEFCKRVNPRFWLKIGNFKILSFCEKFSEKMCLGMFSEEKKAFLNYKSSDFWIFLKKGFSKGFGSKL